MSVKSLEKLARISQASKLFPPAPRKRLEASEHRGQDFTGFAIEEVEAKGGARWRADAAREYVVAGRRRWHRDHGRQAPFSAMDQGRQLAGGHRHRLGFHAVRLNTGTRVWSTPP